MWRTVSVMRFWVRVLVLVLGTGISTAQVCRDRNATDAAWETSAVWKSDSFSLEHGRYLGCADMEGNTQIEKSIAVTLGDIVGSYLTTKTQSGSFIAAMASALLGAIGGVLSKLSNDCITSEGDQIFNKEQQSDLNGLIAPLSAVECGGGTTSTHDNVTLSVLREYYTALHGDGWTTAAGWTNWTNSEGKLVPAHDNYCAWSSIKCDAQGRIFSLSLFFNNMTGTFPESIGSLSTLRVFGWGPSPGLGDIHQLFTKEHSWQAISGTLPASIAKLSSLTNLLAVPFSSLRGDLFPELHPSGISGSLPPSLPQSVFSLVTIGAALTGTVPATFDAVGFVGIWTDTTKKYTISGTLPASWGSSGHLHAITYIMTHLSGSLPQFIGTSGHKVKTIVSQFSPRIQGSAPTAKQTPNLKHMSANLCQISGTVPSDLLDMTRLINYWMSSNSMSGTLPSAAGINTALYALILALNRVSGTVSSSMSSLMAVKTLSFGDNPLSGTIPGGLEQLPRLNGFLAKNTSHGHPEHGISGTLPLLPKSISALILSDNRLSSSLSKAFSEMWSLQFIDLSSNSLEGPLSNFRPGEQLVALHLQQNRLIGPLPSLRNCSLTIKSVLLYHNQLSGVINKEMLKAFPGAGIVPTPAPAPPPAPPPPTCATAQDCTGSDTCCWWSSFLPVGECCPQGKCEDTGVVYACSSPPTAAPTIAPTPAPTVEIPDWKRPSALLYLSVANNRLSGSLPIELGYQKSLAAISLNENSLSGSLPPSFARLTALSTLGLGRNYISGSMPDSWNAMSALKTFFVFSNVLKCNAPGFNAAQGLGKEQFSGIVYPANSLVADMMFESQLLTKADFDGLVAQLEATKPDVPNAVLLYTGNGMLTTSASSLDGTSAPNSLQQDAIRQGTYGLFEGQDQNKQLLFLYLPLFAMVCIVIVFLVCKVVAGLSLLEMKAAIRASFSSDWMHEQHSCCRQLLYSNRFLPWTFVLGVGLFVAYIAVAAQDDMNYSCVKLSVDVSSLSSSLFPWSRSMVYKSENVHQWVFTTSACAFFTLSVWFWGPLSEFAQDTHSKHARRVYSGLLTINELLSYQLLQPKCFKNWAHNSLGDLEERRRRSPKHIVCVVAYWILHAPPAVLFSLPTLGYILSQNVQSDSPIIKALGNTIVVVVVNTILQIALIQRFARWLTRLRQYSMNQNDAVAVNKHIAESLYVIKFASDVFFPVVLQFILDENCMRKYLAFSEPIREIMVYWNQNMQGHSAYRRGFCLSKLVTGFSPIWLLSITQSVFLSPCIMLLTATPQYTKVMKWVTTCLGRSEATAQEKLDQLVDDSIAIIAGVLVNLTTTVAFGLWSPLLLLITPGMPPMLYFVLSFCDALNPSFEARLASRLKVPVPNHVMVVLCIGSLLMSIAFVLIDFGFGISSFLLFSVCIALNIAWGVVQHRQAQSFEADGREGDRGDIVKFCERDRPYLVVPTSVTFHKAANMSKQRETHRSQEQEICFTIRESDNTLVIP